jgi:hypothetical protein
MQYMPVSWETRDSVLIVTVIEDWSGGGPAAAIAEAMADPAFKPGTPLLLDVRQSSMNPSGEEVRSRAEWLSTLRTKGLSKHLAVVMGTKAYQMGLARMAQFFCESREMDLQVFTDMEAAMTWLSGLKGANQVQHYKTQSGDQIH